jgi:hypothetical protein
MTSPKSIELKLGAKEPSMEEAKRCELKLPMEIKRTVRIRCRGCVPIGAITSRYPVKEEKVSTPIGRSTRIRDMKRKDYKEVSAEPKDYGGGMTIPMIVARARGRPPEGKTMTCIIGKRHPRRRLLKVPTAAATTTAVTLVMTTLSGCIRCVVRLVVTPSQSSMHRSTSVSRTWR